MIQLVRRPGEAAGSSSSNYALDTERQEVCR
jgi:hypothetical protein